MVGLIYGPLNLWQITNGERLTLTLWFSRDGSRDEDAKLVSLLSQKLLHTKMDDSCIPLPASSNMYWYSQDQISNYQLGFNICWGRLYILGYDMYISQDSSWYTSIIFWKPSVSLFWSKLQWECQLSDSAAYWHWAWCKTKIKDKCGTELFT